MKRIVVAAVALVALAGAGYNELLTSRYDLPRTHFLRNALLSVSGQCTPHDDLERLCDWFSLLAAVPEHERAAHVERIGSGAARLCTNDVLEVFQAVGSVPPVEKARVIRQAAREEGWRKDWKCAAMDMVWSAPP